jgi:RNA polymerase sigma-70 factor (ECF subfamily)
VVEGLELRSLVERARVSDPEAWEKLYVHAYGRLYAYARRRLPGREEANDAVSETFARAYERIGTFRWRGGGVDAWLYGIARNVVLESLRGRRRRAEGLDPELPSPEPDPADHLIAGEEEVAVREAFARLDPSDQEVLELRVLGGLDARAVSEVVGKRPGAVRMAQSRALARLRSIMLEAERES